MVAQIVTLSEAKLHCRVDTATEDDYIESLIDAACTWLQNYLNQTIPDNADSPVTYPAPLRHAVLLMVGDMYENRSAKVDSKMAENPTLYNLAYPYRTEICI